MNVYNSNILQITSKLNECNLFLRNKKKQKKFEHYLSMFYKNEKIIILC